MPEQTWDNPRDELRAKLVTLNLPIPNRIGKMGRFELARKIAECDKKIAALPKEPNEPEAQKCPKAGPDEVEVPKRLLPPEIEEALVCLQEALRASIARRLYISAGHGQSSVVGEYRKMVTESLRCATGCVLTVSGNGYERGSRLMNVIDRAITDMRNEFTDFLVANSVLSNLLSDKHQVEMARARGEKA